MKKNYNTESNFSQHDVTILDTEKMELIRSKSKELAYMLETFCPDSRERDIALMNLEQSVMWANASISRNSQEVL